MVITPTLLVNVGDLYRDNESDNVTCFFNIEQSLLKDIPLFPAMGTHEYIGGKFNLYRDNPKPFQTLFHNTR